MIVINDDNYQEHLDHSKGLIERNYMSHPVGYLGDIAKPFDLPLIPRNQWQSYIDMKNETNSWLTDIRDIGMNGEPIPSRDQDGYGFCTTSDTEVLTNVGWMKWPDYNWDMPIATVNPHTHAMEFQKPFEKHIYEYNGPIMYSSNRRIDFGVTPYHTMYVRKWDEKLRTLSNQYSFVKACNLGWYFGLLHAPKGQIGTEIIEIEIPGDRRYYANDFIALLGLIISDGYAGGSELTRNCVSFSSFRDISHDEIAYLAARNGFKEAPNREGIWYRYDAGALASWIRETCYVNGNTGAENKCVPHLIKCLSRKQIKYFLHWFDDRNRKGTQYYSVSKQLIDDLQELHLKIGKRSTIGEKRESRNCYYKTQTICSSGEYTLTIGEVDKLCIDKKKHIEYENYKGLVYCAGVPNHTLITRRNGSVLISSNCWAHSSTSACLLVRAIMGLPYADLSAFAVASIIKRYKNQGGWGAESLEWIAENGIPTSNTWPQQACNPKYDTPAMRAEAKQNKVTEWMDGEPRNIDQLVTCLLLNIPVVSDFNWWSHSVCSVRVLSLNPFQTVIWNSWSDTWSERGMGILSGNRAIPDGMIMPRTMIPSII